MISTNPQPPTENSKMKTDHVSTRTITGDQASEIAMRISEARALMYLLGTVARKEPFGITDEPDREEQDGICGLVRLVGQGLSETFKSATSGGSSENALESISRGDESVHAQSGGIREKMR